MSAKAFETLREPNPLPLVIIISYVLCQRHSSRVNLHFREKKADSPRRTSEEPSETTAKSMQTHLSRPSHLHQQDRRAQHPWHRHPPSFRRRHILYPRALRYISTDGPIQRVWRKFEIQTFSREVALDETGIDRQHPDIQGLHFQA